MVWVVSNLSCRNFRWTDFAVPAVALFPHYKDFAVSAVALFLRYKSRRLTRPSQSNKEQVWRPVIKELASGEESLP